MNYNEALEYIHSLGMFSLPPTLERVKKTLKLLGDPQKKLRVIHIAGTNGKGSVCTFIAAALSSAGYKVGLFTSPYIIDFKERIQINGEHIGESELCQLTERVRATNQELTEFEFITVMAFLHFKEIGCDVAVLETGLGGRFDATNVCENVLCNVITKIGLDHTAVLGDTIEKISAEKCAIIKCKNVVSDPFQPEAALEIIKAHHPDVTVPNFQDVDIISCDIKGSRFKYRRLDCEIRLLGRHQISNAIVAIEALKRCGLKLSSSSIKQGLLRAFIPARLEVVSITPPIILDGAHNPDAADVLAEFLREYNGRAVAIFSAMRDKDYLSVMKKTLPFCAAAITVGLSLPRAETTERLAVFSGKYCPVVFKAETTESAIKRAIEIAGDNPIVVFGSLYLAAEVRKYFK